MLGILNGIVLNLLDHAHYFTYTASAFGSFAIYHLISTSSIIYQYQRCISCLSRGANRNDVSTEAENTRWKRIQSAIKLLRIRQGVIFFGGSVCFSVLLLLAGASQHWTWAFVIVGLALPESVVNFCFEFRWVLPRAKKKTVPEKVNAEVGSDPQSVNITHSEMVSTTLWVKKPKKKRFGRFAILSVIAEERSNISSLRSLRSQAVHFVQEEKVPSKVVDDRVPPVADKRHSMVEEVIEEKRPSKVDKLPSTVEEAVESSGHSMMVECKVDV
jgi:hypothetical protein